MSLDEHHAFQQSMIFAIPGFWFFTALIESAAFSYQPPPCKRMGLTFDVVSLRNRKMTKHKNRKLSKAVEPVQQATKKQGAATVASKPIQQATKDRVATEIAPEQIQQSTVDLVETAKSSAKTPPSVQTIATAHAEYAKKAMQDSSEFFAKLTSVRDPAKLMELQSEYVKNAHETFVAEAKKISELYTDFFKQAAKPLEALIAKNKAV